MGSAGAGRNTSAKPCMRADAFAAMCIMFTNVDDNGHDVGMRMVVIVFDGCEARFCFLSLRRCVLSCTPVCACGAQAQPPKPKMTRNSLFAQLRIDHEVPSH